MPENIPNPKESINLLEKLRTPSASPKKRIMKLPKNSAYPHYKGLHLEDEWCAKAGCIPVMDHPGDIGGIDA